MNRSNKNVHMFFKDSLKTTNNIKGQNSISSPKPSGLIETLSNYNCLVELQHTDLKGIIITIMINIQGVKEDTNSSVNSKRINNLVISRKTIM